jgi:hypothetical protein
MEFRWMCSSWSGRRGASKRLKSLPSTNLFQRKNCADYRGKATPWKDRSMLQTSEVGSGLSRGLRMASRRHLRSVIVRRSAQERRHERDRNGRNGIALLLDIELERKSGFACLRSGQHNFANSIRKANCYGQAIVVQTGIKIDFVRPITSRRMVSKGHAPR